MTDQPTAVGIVCIVLTVMLFVISLCWRHGNSKDED